MAGEMKWKGKRIFLTIHAVEQFLKRRIPEHEIIDMLARGVHVPNLNYEGRMLCIYKVSRDSYYTVAYKEGKASVAIITGFPSSAWDVRQYKKVRKT